MFSYLILNNHLQSAKLYHQVSTLTWKQHLMSTFSKGHRQSFFKIFSLLQNLQQKLEFYLRVYFLIYPIHPTLNQNHKNFTIPQKQINSFRQYLDTKGSDLAKTSQFLQFYALPFIKKPLQHSTFKTLFTKIWVQNLKQKLNQFLQIEQEYMKIQIKKLGNNVCQAQIQNQIRGNGENKENTSKKQKEKTKHENMPLKRLQQQIGINNNFEQKLKVQHIKIIKLQQTNAQLFNQIGQIQAKYKSLQENHQAMIESFNQYMMQSQNKWFQSYKDLVKTSKMLIQICSHIPINNPKLERKYIQSKKKVDKYQKFVAKKLQDLMSISQDLSIFDKPSMNQISQYTMKSGYTSKSWLPNVLDKNYTNNNNNVTSYVQIDEYISINFSKLNYQFDKLSEMDQNLIISGLCWRLIKSKSKQIRRFYCISLIKYNFLGINKIDSSSQLYQLQFCTQYLQNPAHPLTLYFLQLLNYLKDDYFCRRHLFFKHNITDRLIFIINQSLINFKDQSDDCDSLQLILLSLDIVSTISAYHDYRYKLLESQLPLFLLNVLESYPKLFECEQLMELLMMILMNFSSFDQGLKMFQQFQNVFSTLSIAFQQINNHDIIMLVNGFYYTLLGNKRLYEIAIESNLPQFIKYLLGQPQYKQHQRQLRFIEERLSKYTSNTIHQTSAQNSPEQQLYFIDGQQQDEGDLQIAMQDQLDNLQEYIKGHQILMSRYSLRDKQHEQQQKQVRKVDNQFQKQMQKKRKEQKYQHQSKETKQKINNSQEENPKTINTNKNTNKNTNAKQGQKNIIYNSKQSLLELQGLQFQDKKQIPSLKPIPQQNRIKKALVLSKQNQLKLQQIQYKPTKLQENKLKNSNSLTQQLNKENSLNIKQVKSIKNQSFNQQGQKNLKVEQKQIPNVKNSKQDQFMRSQLLQKNSDQNFLIRKYNQNTKQPIIYQGQYKNQNYVYGLNSNSSSKLNNLINEAGSQQKNRRKQILKQINEQIQTKKHSKAQRNSQKKQGISQKKLIQKQSKSISSASQRNVLNKIIKQAYQGQNHDFNKNKVITESQGHQPQKWLKGVRSNIHMKKQPFIKEQIEKQRKAFESKPKIVRTPPKQQV